MPKHDGPELELRGIEKSFGATKVLEGIDALVRSGEFVSLIGPSGCGKTTLLRIIGGFDAADRGSVLLGGKPIDSLSPAKRPINTVFQSYALFPHLTVHRNVAFGLENRRTPKAEVEARVRRMLEATDLDALRDRLPETLSGGEKQRVALARALVCEPSLLLLDEPLSAIDAGRKRALEFELRSLKERTKSSFILVTHDHEEALAVSDRVFVMNRGLIEQSGTPEELHAAPRTPFVATFLGYKNFLPFEGVVGECIAKTSIGPLRLETPLTIKSGVLTLPGAEIELARESAGENTGRATVRSRLFLGDHFEVELETHGRSLYAKAPLDAQLEVGSTPSFHLPPRALRVLHG